MNPLIVIAAAATVIGLGVRHTARDGRANDDESSSEPILTPAPTPVDRWRGIAAIALVAAASEGEWRKREEVISEEQFRTLAESWESSGRNYSMIPLTFVEIEGCEDVFYDYLTQQVTSGIAGNVLVVYGDYGEQALGEDI